MIAATNMDSDASLLEISEIDKPPTGCNERESKRLEAKRVSDNNHVKTVEFTERCTALDFDENLSAETQKRILLKLRSQMESETKHHMKKHEKVCSV